MTLEELKAKRNEQGQKAQELQNRLSDLRRDGEKAIRETRQEFDDAELECQVLDRKIAELEAPPVDRTKQCTIHHQDPEEVRKQQQADPPTGQHADYIILCEEERAKGFVRPVRHAYEHVGKKLRGTLEKLDEPYVSNGQEYTHIDRFMVGGHKSGTYLTAKEVRSVEHCGYYGGCGTVTTMGQALAETYARDPHFYGATFCCTCNKHLPIHEFVWKGTTEVLGS